MSSEQPNEAAAEALDQAKAASQQMILETAVEEAEAEATTLRKERDEMKSRYESQEGQLRTAQDEIRTLRESLLKNEAAVDEAKRDAKSRLDKCSILEEESKNNKERADRLMAEADTLREEISDLTKKNVDFKKQISDAETASQLGESEIVPLRFQVNRLESEISSMRTHSAWLESENKSKDAQLAAVRAETSSELAELRADYDRVLSDKETAESSLVSEREHATKLESDNERLQGQLLQVRHDATENKLAFEQELVAEKRLVSLQKEQLDRDKRRYNDAIQEYTSLQTRAGEAEEMSQSALTKTTIEMKEEFDKVVKDQDRSHKAEITELKRKLGDALRGKKQAEDSLLQTATPARQPLLEITAGAASDEPLNTTVLYTRLTETQDALRLERIERQKVDVRFKRLNAEIQAMGPSLARQKQDHEMAMDRCEEYQKRLEAAHSESNAYRGEADELRVQLSSKIRENKTLKENSVQLAKQVQILLTSNMSSGEDVTESSIPRSVQEMQSQNQRLLQEQRRQTERIAELEEKTRSDPLLERAETAEKEVEALREERRRQEVLVDGLVQQRDLYRALVSKHDPTTLGTGSEETSALQIVKNQSERAKTLQERNTQMENDLVAARAELSTVAKDKEAAAERLARYEAVTAELQKNVDRLQVEVSKGKAEVARSEADASFNRDKCARLEETLTRSRSEVMQVTSAKNELQRITADLQKAISAANAEKSRIESEMRQVNRKLGLLEQEAEAAASAERRAREEATQLRSEVARQGQLLDSMHRIEAQLSAKGAQELESLREEVERVTKQLSEARSKHAEEIAKLTTRIQDQDTQIKEVELSKEKATQGELKAKNDTLKAASDIETLRKNCNKLELQLRAAKRRLGESGDEKDVEEELQNTITNLKQELETAKSELATAKERAATFQKLSKNGEKALEELTKAAKDSKQVHIDEVNGLKEQVESAQKESASRQEVITELTNDLASYRSERDKALAELNKQITVLRTEAEQYQKDADTATTQAVSLQAEVTTLRLEVKTAQENYERELTLHSEARTALRVAKEETDTEARLRKAAEEGLESIKNDQAEKIGLLDYEKSALEGSFKKAEKQLEEAREQNSKLIDQLQALGEQIEKEQAKISEEDEGEAVEGEDAEIKKMRKSVSELRELVKFLRSDKEMVQAQLDSAKRAADRERAEGAVVKRSLDEARAELKVLQDSARAAEAASTSDEVAKLKESVQTAEEQSRLLGDSNTLLREEVKTLQTSLSELKKELETSKQASQPSEKRLKELESEKAGFDAEKASLLREIEDWKKRVQSLVSKFNQVDPVEHAKALKKVEALEKETATLSKAKTDAEGESKRIRTLATRVSKDLMQNKTLVETQKKSIAKLTAEKEELVKSSKDTAPAKELQQVKEQLSKLQTERTSEKTQLEGATQMNDRLRERLRQFQKNIQELRKKDISNTAQLKEALAEVEKLKASAGPKGTETVRSRPTSPHVLRGTSPVPPAGSTASTSVPTGEGDGLATVDEGTETTKEPAASAPPQEPTTETAKPKAVPKVPAGGFKFGPSASGDSEGAKPAEPPASTTLTKAKKRPATETTESTAPEKKKAAIKIEKPAETSTSQSAGEEAVGEAKPSESSESPKPPTIGRRMSGEKKEMNIKEKLLEKKRKLEAMKKAKEAAAENLKKRTKTEAAKPPPKEESTASTGKATIDTPVEDSAAEPATDKPETEKTAVTVEDKDDVAGGEKDGAPEGEGTGEDSKEGEQAAAAATATSTFTETEAKTTGAFGSASGTPTLTFGSSSNIKPFGATTFGQATASGTSSVFGSSGFGTGVPTTFGAAAAAAAPAIGAPSGFGDKAAGSTAAPFGSAFLDMKPPGSSTAPSQLIFGQSPSITLPTPAQKSPSNAMFSAFSSSNKPYSSGGVTAKPLFGSKKEDKAEATAKDEDDEEEGEVEDPESNV